MKRLLRVRTRLKQRRSSDPTERREAEKSEITSVRFLLGILAIYTYFAGWLYAFYLFRHFGIALHTIDLPLQYFYVYSYTVFADWLGILILSTVVAVGYLLALLGWGKWLTIPLLILLIPVVVAKASSMAEVQALRIRRGEDSKPILLTLKGGLDSIRLGAANQEGRLRLLGRSKEDLYVFFQPRPGDNEPEWPSGFVYRLRSAEVSITEIRLGSFPKNVSE